MTSLSLLVFSPALGALLVAIVPSVAREAMRRTAVAVSLLPFVVSLILWSRFDVTDGDFQMVERVAWIPQFGVSYFLGIDGISLLLILLTTFLVPLVLVMAGDTVRTRLKGYLVALLLLETTMLGTLAALDLVLFYVFWELMLVPMFLIIGVWGGPRRVYAALKFILYTLAGSLPMLVAIVWLGVEHASRTGTMSFAIPDLYAMGIAQGAQLWLFGAFFLAFAVKVPMWPLHTWLPDAHVEAPTGGSVILAGVMLKMGSYGFLRLAWPLCPEAASGAAGIVALLAVIGIVYGALVAMAQPDLKKMVAYSSVSHLGFVMLGLASMDVIGVEGAVYQMLAHGLSTGALFMVVGMLYQRCHTRRIEDLGGLWQQMPVLGSLFLVITLASIGLPGLNGFVGEFLILVGAFKVFPLAATVALVGIVLGAVYMLRMYQRVMFGPVTRPENTGLMDLSRRELGVLLPVVVLIVLMGVYPRPFLRTMEASVERSLRGLRANGISALAPPAVARSRSGGQG